MRPSRWTGLVVFVLGLVTAVPAAAQGGITGKVTNKENNQPVGSAPIEVIGSAGQTVARAATGTDGIFRVASLPAGTYMVSFRAIGYKEVRVQNVVVGSSGTTTVNVALEAAVYQLEQIVTAVSRAPEKTTEAPAPVSVVSETEVVERPSLSVIEHVKGLPGVDISQGGLVQSNVVGRGFNNIFSGALLMLIDNRFASVPSLRVNVPGFFTATDQDIEQMVFVLGPAAALYGPNSANGVLAITTKSPFDSKGTVLSLEAGYRGDSRYPNCSPAWYGQESTCGQSYDNGTGLWRAGLRHAGTIGSKFGYKISGEYLKGTEWRYRDPAEPTPLPNASQLGITCNTVTGCRDFNLEKYNLDVRMDARPGTSTEIIGAFGYNNAAHLIEYTGIGAGQARDWAYSYAQLRVRHKKLFAQVFGNFSNSGNSSRTDYTGTFLFRDGNTIVDNSRVLAAQIQHGVDFGTTESLLYGVDYAWTNARTDSTVNGRNENIDNITEVGGYIHSVTHVGSKLDLVAALRLDKHSALKDVNWSPRAAVVYKLGEDQNIRFTYNRAFSTPSNNNLFLDIVAGGIPSTPFKVRALGVPQDGFNFRGYCGQGGVGDLCMWSPWVPQTAASPALAAPYWVVAREAVLARLAGALPPNLAPLAPVIAQVLRAVPNPTPGQVGTTLRRLDPTALVFNDVTTDQVQDIPALKPTITNTFELGYKGIIKNKFRIDASAWHNTLNNFVGPLIVESPNVFLDLQTTGSYLGSTFAPALVQALVAGGMNAQQAAAIAAALTPTLAGGMAGLSGSKTAPGVPLGTVVPDSPLTQSGDMFLTYRNFGSVELWGADLAFDYLVTDKWSFGGMYSWVNKDYFTREEACTPHGDTCAPAPTDVPLNAPKNKAAGYVRFREGVNGFGAETRVRYVAGFPINSGVYTTPIIPNPTNPLNYTRQAINDYTLVDLQVGYQFKWGLMASLNVQNLFNRNYQTFAGLPQLGRLVMTRLAYTF